MQHILMFKTSSKWPKILSVYDETSDKQKAATQKMQEKTRQVGLCIFGQT